MTADRAGNPVEETQEGAGFLRFLYRNSAGRVLLKLFASRPMSKLVGAYMNSRLSLGRVRKCMTAYGVKTEELEKDSFSSFNDFFTRKKREEFLSVCTEENEFPAPADSRVTAVRLQEGTAFPVKGAPYTAAELLGSDSDAQPYRDGWALVFRLAPNDYHRYIYPDGGTETGHRFIPGVLHTVSPVATEILPVFHRNCREVTFLKTDHFGDLCFTEVGAMLVGRIVNAHPDPETRFDRGQEKGYFAFGGSTIVVLLKNGAAVPDGDILRNSAEGKETLVRLGEPVAHRDPQ